MKNLIRTSIIALSILTTTQANAFYIGAGYGNSKTKTDGLSLDSSTAFSLSTGMSIPLPLFPIRAELEYIDLKSDDEEFNPISSYDIKTNTYGFGANAFVSLPLLPIIKPYIGFGLAYMQQKTKIFPQLGNNISEKSDWQVVPQYMFGFDVSLPIIPIAGGVEYRFIDANFDYDAIGKKESKIHTFLVKARYKF